MEQLSGGPPRLRLSPSEFRQIAAGPVSADIVAKLRSAQMSRTTLVIKGLMHDSPGLSDAAWQLATAHDARPDAVDAIIAHPWLGAWAVDRVRAPDDGRPDYLANAALAACALAGVPDAETTLHSYQGVLAVPEFGVKTHRGERVTLTAADLSGPGWTAPRRLALRWRSAALRLTVDDIDPYRACYGLRAAARLDTHRARALERSLEGAWRLLVDYSGGYATELSAGLRFFVPLGDAGAGRHSVTHSDGFGAFAAEPDLDPVDFAVTMLHEFQHSKLSATLNLVRLFEPGDDRRYFSPWRVDPRPISGLIHGVQAFAAVADLWSGLRAHPGLADRATRQLAQIRVQIDRAVDELSRATTLTSTGRLWLSYAADRSAGLMVASMPGATGPALPETERASRGR